MADMIKFFKGLEANLPASGVNGALYITTDEGAIYLGTGTGMKRLGDFVQVANVASLPEKAHESCLYYCVAENILAKWNGTEWKQINKQPTAEELKTLLGLGTLAYKSEVVEGDLNSDLAAKINAASGAQHTHTFVESELNKIADGDVAKWNASEQNAKDYAKDYADGLNTAMNGRVEALEAIDHEHANKALLDTYTQTEADLADAVAKKHSHNFADEAAISGITAAKVADWDDAVSKEHTHTFADADVVDAISKKHSHSFNETELNKIVEGDVAKWNSVAADYLDSEDETALKNLIKEAKQAGTDANTNIESYKVTNDARVKAVEDDVAEIVDGENGILAQAKSYFDGKLATARTEISAEIDADVKVVADEIAGYKSSNDTALAGVKATADAAAEKLTGVSEGANKVEASATNGNIKIDGVETVVYTHPASHTVSEISDFDDKVKAYDYATKTEAQAMADGKDEAIATAKKAGDDAQDAIDAYIESNDAALAAETKARTDADAGFETRIAALEANFGDGEGTVEAQIAAAVAAEAEIARAAEKANADDIDALEGRMDTAEGKIADLETESAKHALKTELEAVDAKFADYKTAADQKAIDDEQDRRLGVIEGDYLKAADIANFETKANVKKVADDLAAYVESNDAAVADRYTKEEADAKFALIADAYDDTALSNRVKAIEDDYLTSADKTELQGNIDTVSSALERLTNGVSADEIDGVNDLINYVNEHGPEVTGMKADIAANAKAISDQATSDAATYETKTDSSAKLTEAKGYTDTEVAKDRERLAALEAIDHDAYKGYADGLNAAIDSRVKVLEAIDHDAYKNADIVVLVEAQEYADQAEIEAVTTAKAYTDSLLVWGEF